jgi:hypothetical protein
MECTPLNANPNASIEMIEKTEYGLKKVQYPVQDRQICLSNNGYGETAIMEAANLNVTMKTSGKDVRVWPLPGLFSAIRNRVKFDFP